MNILRRLQLVAHGEPSDVIELSSLEPATTKQEDDWVPHRFFDRPRATNQLSLMWIIKSAREPVYTVFKNPTMKGMMMKTEKNLSVMPGESRGIWAAIAKTYETAQCYRHRRTFPDETRTHRGVGNEEFPPVDERRGRYGHYPLTE